MGHVQISPKVATHPSFIRMRPRSTCAWLFSVCWLSKNGRADAFPAGLEAEFGATRIDTAALMAEELWIDQGDRIRVPQVCAWGNQLWKFGPLDSTRPKIPERIRFAVYERDGWRCLFCGTDANLSLDHIHPFSRGGSDALDNLQTLCRSCNSRKGARV